MREAKRRKRRGGVATNWENLPGFDTHNRKKKRHIIENCIEKHARLDKPDYYKTLLYWD